MELAQELVSRAPGLVAYKDKDGYTPLHRAAYTDNASMVRFLLAKGAKVNEVTEDGWTPLHSASHWNSFKAVRELVDHFADVNATTNGGRYTRQRRCMYSSNIFKRYFVLIICSSLPQDKLLCTSLLLSKHESL
jgi:ankyrin repeat protein